MINFEENEKSSFVCGQMERERFSISLEQLFTIFFHLNFIKIYAHLKIPRVEHKRQ